LTQSILSFAREITLDEVVHIEHAAFSGHVYNLQTEPGWYIANEIITHNCRCTFDYRIGQI
jgi:hypothetical protein